MSRSVAYPFLARLLVGDSVPPECYVLDHADGTPGRWLVHSRHLLSAGVLDLVLVDDDNRDDDGDLFTPGTPAAVRVLTWPDKTMRTQPYQLGRQSGPTLCDMDQQARHVRQSALAGAV